MASGPRVSLHEIQRLSPINSLDEVLDQARVDALSPDSKVWSLETIPLEDVDPDSAFYDDPDAESEATIQRLVSAFRGKESVPPLLLVHAPEMPKRRGTLFLWDGMHRFTAASRAGLLAVRAWVAHTGGCCTGPD